MKCTRAWSCIHYPHGGEIECYGIIEGQEELKQKGQFLPRCTKKKDCCLPEGHHKAKYPQDCFTIAETDAYYRKRRESDVR